MKGIAQSGRARIILYLLLSSLDVLLIQLLQAFNLVVVGSNSTPLPIGACYSLVFLMNLGLIRISTGGRVSYISEMQIGD